MLSKNDREALRFSLSQGHVHDVVEGYRLLSDLQNLDSRLRGLPLFMDSAYQGSKIREKAIKLGFNPAISPKSNNLKP